MKNNMMMWIGSNGALIRPDQSLDQLLGQVNMTASMWTWSVPSWG